MKLRLKPRRMNRLQRREMLQEIFRRFAAENPAPRCELYHETPYQLLVSVVLSAQTTDKRVNLCMTPLYKGGLSPETILAWGPEGLLEKIKSIGLANTKSKNVYRLSKILLEKHGGVPPDTREELEALPGVGRKTASVVLGELYRQPTLAVDTHVYRVGKRLGLHKEESPLKAEKPMLAEIPSKYLPTAHHWFVLHGRYICKAQKPACERCLLRDICPSLDAIS